MAEQTLPVIGARPGAPVASAGVGALNIPARGSTATTLTSKLAAALSGRASDELLDSYEAERIVFARRLVATTDKAFSFATAEGAVADLLRTRVFRTP